jgi:hypothetical protein
MSMDLTLALAAMPLWLSGFLVVVIPTFAAMCGPTAVRRIFALEKIVANNEVAGFKFAVLGVIYAVLLGFAVIVVWERFSQADGAAAQEAGALASIYRLSSGLDSQAQASLRERLSDYTKSAVVDEWPEMAQGSESSRTRQALTGVYAAVLAYAPSNSHDAVLMAELLDQLDRVTQERRERLELAEGIVPGLVWLVLFVGAIITIGFTFFFGLRNLRVQTAMTGMLALMIFLSLFVAISIDHPFTGPVHVTPDSFNLVLADFSGGQSQQTP